MELPEDVQVAVSTTEAFVNVLTTEGLNGWAARFSSILAQLRAGDVQAATHSFRNCSYTGPGGSTPLPRTLRRSLIMGQEECHATATKVQRRVQA